eukprot:1962381-Pleurochrysis_carterae.AAC.2
MARWEMANEANDECRYGGRRLWHEANDWSHVGIQASTSSTHARTDICELSQDEATVDSVRAKSPVVSTEVLPVESGFGTYSTRLSAVTVMGRR